MVTITVVASYALLEIDMGQVGDQLRENGPADIHPPLFRRCLNALRADFRPFSVQIVFSPKAVYVADFKGFNGFRKVLYRTLVDLVEAGKIDQALELNAVLQREPAREDRCRRMLPESIACGAS